MPRCAQSSCSDRLYPKSQWKNMFGAADYRFLDDQGVGGPNLDARTMFHYGYPVNTPAMVAKLVGRGSQYALAFGDKAGNPFERQDLPAQRPGQGKLVTNAVGSVDVYFGPRAPAGTEANWIASVPGKGCFVIFRL